MENAESPVPVNLSTRPVDRNVLRESNKIEWATKSPKEISLADQTEINAKDNLPVTDTGNRLSIGSDKVPVNKNLLRVATPTEYLSVSDDEEFLDCNTTFSSSINNSVFDKVLDETFVNAEKESVPLACESNDPLASNKKLNLGFIEAKNSGVDNLDANKPTADVLNSEDSEYDLKGSRSKETTISPSFNDDSRITVSDECNKLLVGVSNDSNENSLKEGITVPEITVDHDTASQTAINEVESKRTFECELGSDSKTPAIDLKSQIQSESLSEATAESTTPKQQVPYIEPAVADIESTEGVNNVSAVELNQSVETNAKVELEPAKEVETLSESAVLNQTAPVIQSEPEIELEPARQLEVAIASDISNESAPVIESEVGLESVVLSQTQPIQSEVTNASTPSKEAETTIPLESAVESQPSTELEPTATANKDDLNQTCEMEWSPSEPENQFHNQETVEIATESSEIHPSDKTESSPTASAESIQFGTLETAIIAEESKTLRSDAEVTIPLESAVESQPSTELEPTATSELAQVSNTLNVTCNTDGIAVSHSETTFTANKDELNQTCEMEWSLAEPENRFHNQETVEIATESSETHPTDKIESSPTASAESSQSITAIITEESTTLRSDAEVTIQRESAVESKPTIDLEITAKSELAQVSNALNVTCNMGGTAICQPGSTFIDNNDEINRTIEMECSETEPENQFKIHEAATTAVESSEIESNLSKSTHQSTIAAESETLQSDAKATGQVESAIEPLSNTELEPTEKSELAQVSDTLNVTSNTDGNSVCQPSVSTFTGQNEEMNQTVEMESSPSKSAHQSEAVVVATIASEPQTFDDLNVVNQVNKISGFKANQSFSVDSLEQDSEPQDCSLDSLEMKLDDPSTPTVSGEFTQRLDRTNTFDMPNPVGASFEKSGPVVDLNGSISALSRKETFSVESPQNESIPSITRQDTYSLLLSQNGNNSPSSAAPHHDSYSPQSDSCSSIDDITVLLNKATINSPKTNVADSSKRMVRNATFEKANSDSEKSPSLPGDGATINSPKTKDADSSKRMVRNATFEKTNSDNEKSPSLPGDGSNALGATSQTIPFANAINSTQDPVSELVLGPSDFDFLQSRGGKKFSSEEDRRSSLLLRFDPLSDPAIQKQKLPSTEEVVEPTVDTELQNANQTFETAEENIQNEQSSSKAGSSTANDTEMSVSLVHDSKSMDNDTNSFINNIKSDTSGIPMTDKNYKFEYADENIRKKMEEYAATEEILRKRLAEKEKTFAKNCSIIEAYEKTLAEIVAETEQLRESREAANERVRQERDTHYAHLMSLEITFSDLHKKYELSKEIAAQLLERIDILTEEKAEIDELIKQAEVRYERLKKHALEQLEYANSTLEEQEKSGLRENARLKAILKIEEVSRKTMEEQLEQKIKENRELVQICDELIGRAQRS